MKTFNDLKVGDTVYRIDYNTMEGGSESGWIRTVEPLVITEIKEIRLGKLIKYNESLGFTILKENYDSPIQSIIYDGIVCCDKGAVMHMIQSEMREFEEHHEKLIDKLWS